MKHLGFALSQLPERFQSKFDTQYEFVNVNGKNKQRFFVKELADSPRFDSLKEVHQYIASLEHGQLAEYISRKYSHYGYKSAKHISYGPEYKPDYLGKFSGDRYRWVENVTDGLRFVGAAHDIIKLCHTGWFTDNWNSETVHGEVYQLPSRNGVLQFVAAVDDPNNNGCACVCFTDVTDDKEQCARWADSMAEKWAESEREYQAKDDQERRIEEIGEEITAEYQKFRELAREIRKECGQLQGSKVVAKLVKAQWDATKAKIHKLRAQRARIEENGVEY